MLRLIIFFLFLIAFSFSASWLLENDGIVSAEWFGYRLDATITSILFIIALSFFIFYFILTAISFLLRIPSKMKRCHSQSQSDKMLQVLTGGFAAIIASDTKRARKFSQEALRLIGVNPHGQLLAHMLAAKTALMEDNSININRHFSVLLENDSTRFLALKGLMENSAKDGNIEEALNYAKKAYKLEPNMHGTAFTLLNLYKRMGRWSDVQLFLEQHSTRRFFSLSGHDEGFDISREKALALYIHAKEFYDKKKELEAFELASKAVKIHAGFTPAVKMAAEIALNQGRKGKAISLITRGWKGNPHPELAAIYMEIYESDTGKRKVKRARKLASFNPKSVESHRLIGRIALGEKEFHTAEKHLKLAISKKETSSLCTMMAEVKEMSIDGSTQASEEWKTRAKYADLDYVWKCVECGEIASGWDIKCSCCNAIDSIIWSTPPKNASSEKAISSTSP